MNFKSPNQIKPELNMTQLIDVVLLLLIFFMISSSFVVQPGLKVNLPKSTSQELQPENQYKLIITKEYRLYLDNQRVTAEELVETLARKQAEQKRQFLLVKADETVSHGFVVQIMDVARSLNLEIGIATRPKDGFETEVSEP